MLKGSLFTRTGTTCYLSFKLKSNYNNYITTATKNYSLINSFILSILYMTFLILITTCKGSIIFTVLQMRKLSL